jgi:hypothetical protein
MGKNLSTFLFGTSLFSSCIGPENGEVIFGDYLFEKTIDLDSERITLERAPIPKSTDYFNKLTVEKLNGNVFHYLDSSGDDLQIDYFSIHTLQDFSFYSSRIDCELLKFRQKEFEVYIKKIFDDK